MIIKEFKGQCKGVRLVPRGINDPHICVQIITEDDENWFESDKSFSSAWLDELIEQLQEARVWLATQEPDIYEGQQYGWELKQAK